MSDELRFVEGFCELRGPVTQSVQSSQRQTPLMLASRLGHYKAVESLIKCQAKIEMRDRLGRTALMHAALNGHYPTVAMLLNKGANANASDLSDNTALHYAAAYGWYHVVQLLLQGGATPDVVNQGESIIISNNPL